VPKPGYKKLAGLRLVDEFLGGDELAAVADPAVRNLPALGEAVAVEPVLAALAARFESARAVAEKYAFEVGRHTAPDDCVAGALADQVGKHRQAGVTLERRVEALEGVGVGEGGGRQQAGGGAREKELAAVHGWLPVVSAS
jgi:hypothetical protein